MKRFVLAVAVITLGGCATTPQDCDPGNRDAGAFLRERMFRPGATLSWRDLVEALSGRPLDPSFYLAALERTAA